MFSVVLLYVALKRGFPRKCARFVLFRLIKRRSFNLLCVLDIFSERWQSVSYSFSFFFFLILQCSLFMDMCRLTLNNAIRVMVKVRVYNSCGYLIIDA